MINPMHLSRLRVVILAGFAGLFVNSAVSRAGTDPVPAVRSDMLVSAEWLAQRLDDPAVIILHVAKEKSPYDDGHIPGARFVGWDDLTATRDGVPNELPPVAELQKLFERLGVGNEARLILYGENFGLFAARAYFTLDYLGHGARAALLDGGIEKWKADQRPLSTETPNVRPAPFTPNVNPALVAGLDTVRKLSQTSAQAEKQSTILVDARPVKEYSGEINGDGISRGGHIPGAASLFWMQNLESKENPVLRPVDEMRRRFEEAGAVPGSQVITYCRTGGQASHAYFTAKYLGYDAVMYDGSYFEWSHADDTAVKKCTER